mmetsp:Transcript_14117/g.43951  ORF Transcript_14117/g.43951 Transcript_14117/m.43951 type:complete len:330 (-) Transcript_14117:129-1118(-)
MAELPAVDAELGVHQVQQAPPDARLPRHRAAVRRRPERRLQRLRERFRQGGSPPDGPARVVGTRRTAVRQKRAVRRHGVREEVQVGERHVVPAEPLQLEAGVPADLTGAWARVLGAEPVVLQGGRPLLQLVVGRHLVDDVQPRRLPRVLEVLPQVGLVALVHDERRPRHEQRLPDEQLALVHVALDHPEVPHHHVGVAPEVVRHAHRVRKRRHAAHGHVPHLEAHARGLEDRPQRVAAHVRVRLLEVVAVAGDVAHAADRDHERIPQRKGPQKPLDELLPALRAARKHDAFAQPVEVRPVELEDLPSRVGDLLLDPGDLGRVGGAARCV